MNLSELLGRASRLQASRGFKIASSVVIALLIVGGYATYAVLVASGRVGGTSSIASSIDPDVLATPSGQVIQSVLSGDNGLVGLGVAAALTLAIWLAVTWLGSGLTFLAVLVLSGGVIGGMYLADLPTRAAWVVLGLVFLGQGFAVGVQALRAAFGLHTPVFAVARNVLNEAIRMKISLVFIVILAIALAVIPSQLDPDKALRYRVQTFLQWGTGGSFWILALLTLLFGAATVTFEQRDKTIWQTITKPVAAWQYVLGKWLGLVGLNAVLLTVCSGGVFLFTEYLRSTPALGEKEAYVSANEGQAMTEDRFLLETEVLASRDTQRIIYPPEFEYSDETFQTVLEDRIARERLSTPGFATTAADRAAAATQLLDELRDAYRSVGPGQAIEYRFTGLERARERSEPITFRFKLDAASARPDVFFTVSMRFLSSEQPSWEIRRIGLGYYHSVQLLPEAINEDGELWVELVNGQIGQTQAGALAIRPNPETIRFAPDGLQVTYSVGSYHLNYLRVALVLWIKLAVLAMLAVWAGTFLSFPVACLVAFGTFILAEMSGWLADSGDMIGYTDNEGNLVWYKVISTPVAQAVGFIFQVYDGLRPIESIVEGRRLAWTDVGFGVIVLAVMATTFYGLAVMVFSRRELAIYSGQ
ncbi:MAG: hypothetical protein CMJ31_08710 [Phycisphaerae bacterium]|nr:hypothetical protein [Phycisphaerae bacterium]